jgi:hypothetical protein
VSVWFKNRAKFKILQYTQGSNSRKEKEDGLTNIRKMTTYLCVNFNLPVFLVYVHRKQEQMTCAAYWLSIIVAIKPTAHHATVILQTTSTTN